MDQEGQAKNERIMRMARAMLPEERAADYTGPKDAIHERAHEVIKDLLNGRIGQPTRDQIGKALGSSKATPEPKAMPNGALRFVGDDRRKVGG